jgi:hypothetical protein
MARSVNRRDLAAAARSLHLIIERTAALESGPADAQLRDRLELAAAVMGALSAGTA